MSISDAIERFIGTGEVDPRFPDWEGSAVERRERGTAACRDVLKRIVGYRSARGPGRRMPEDLGGRVRERVRPMVEGLHAAGVLPEAAAFLHTLDRRVHVVTPNTFGALVDTVPLDVGWDLANLLLDDLGAPPLSDDTPELDGLCNGGHAWLLPRAFAEARPWSDVVVHEVAHLLHTMRRSEITGGDKSAGVLLPVPPRRRETFAYACEVWACIDRMAPESRSAALVDYRDSATPPDARVDRQALDRLLAAAAGGGAWGSLAGWAVTGR